MMKIAIPLASGRLSPHFGHAERFAFIEADEVTGQIREQTEATPPPHVPGALPRWLHEQGINVIIAGGMGQHAKNLLAQNGITIKAGVSGGSPEELVTALLGGTLQSGVPGCDHKECHH